MGKKNEKVETKTTTPVTIKAVTLNPKSGYFFDPTSRLKLTKDMVVDVTPEMEVSKRFKVAVENGHLMIIQKEVVKEDIKQPTQTENYSKALQVYDESTQDDIIENFKKAFDLETLKKMAVEDFKIEIIDMPDDDLIDEIILKIDEIVLENEK